MARRQPPRSERRSGPPGCQPCHDPEAIGGFQVSSLFNYTDGQLSGLQLGLINKARIIKGKHTLPPTKAKGLQFGLVNFSKEMDGTQIGLVNFGGAALGKQFGLINFFSKYPTKERTNKNTPVGLLNFGSKGSTKRRRGHPRRLQEVAPPDVDGTHIGHVQSSHGCFLFACVPRGNYRASHRSCRSRLSHLPCGKSCNCSIVGPCIFVKAVSVWNYG